MIEKLIKAGLRLPPESARFVVTRELAARPRRAPVSEAERDALRAAEPVSLGADARIPAWAWGYGPAVALVHGWGGRAAQMAPLAQRIAEAGFRTIAFDVAGHGESKVREASWASFIRDISDVAVDAGPLAGLIGHSAGAWR